MLRPSIECAESAIGYAHVRVIDVAVDDVRDHIARMEAFAHTIRFGTELDERRIRVEVEEIAHRSGGWKKGQRSVRHDTALYETTIELRKASEVGIRESVVQTGEVFL